MLEPVKALDPALLGTDTADERWQRAWEQRPLLLAMARSRVGWHEAEDVVSEALVRAQQATDVPPAALRSWLITTTIRLCADTHRAAAREAGRRVRAGSQTITVIPGPEDEVVERDEARWFARQLRRLPERQAEVVSLRSEGQEITSIAGRMDLPYKAVESLLSRARRSLRGWAAVAVGVWALSRFLTRRAAQLHVAAAVVIAGVNIGPPALLGAATSVSQRGGTVQIAPGYGGADRVASLPASSSRLTRV